MDKEGWLKAPIDYIEQAQYPEASRAHNSEQIEQAQYPETSRELNTEQIEQAQYPEASRAHNTEQKLLRPGLEQEFVLVSLSS